MLTAKRFRLNRATLALESQNGSRSAVTVPSGAIVEVTSSPTASDDTGTVSVLWDGRNLAMFAIDVQARGTEITDLTAGA
jgi:hypothetical protein